MGGIGRTATRAKRGARGKSRGERRAREGEESACRRERSRDPGAVGSVLQAWQVRALLAVAGDRPAQVACVNLRGL